MSSRKTITAVFDIYGNYHATYIGRREAAESIGVTYFNMGDDVIVKGKYRLVSLRSYFKGLVKFEPKYEYEGMWFNNQEHVAEYIGLDQSQVSIMLKRKQIKINKNEKRIKRID